MLKRIGYMTTYALPSYCAVSSWASSNILPFWHHKGTEVSVKAKMKGSAAIGIPSGKHGHTARNSRVSRNAV